jgi:diaminohydroxyphosphoribosylaminopyrimidine deaminase / 5-amino-6-(5-phosphoribosylamino)uracil reductase
VSSAVSGFGSVSDTVGAEAAMARAVRLAERGWGRVYPNPMVGAVVVRDGHVVGEGWHAEFGEAHAEVVALNQAGAAARGATLYVSLEPCAHHGKQPPCVDAIRAAGVARVVAAVRDPDPAAGGGAGVLESAGIPVSFGPFADQVDRLNFRFLQRFRHPTRPFVTVKLAVTMDGMIADSAGRSRWISGPEARQWVHHLRAGYAGIAVGGTTAMRDRVRLTVRGDVVPRRAPVRIVVTRSLDEPPPSLVAAGSAAPVVLLRVDPAAAPRRSERGDVTTITAPGLVDALAALAADGIDSVLVEGGGRLAGALLARDLVDRIHQVQSPVWLGRGVPAWGERDAAAIDEARRWHTIERLALGDDTVLTMER